MRHLVEQPDVELHERPREEREDIRLATMHAHTEICRESETCAERESVVKIQQLECIKAHTLTHTLV